MNFKLRVAAAAIMAVCVVSAYGQTSDTKPAVKKHVAAKKEKAPAAPTVAEQIQALRQELQGQIDGLKQDLANKDAQLQKAQQAAADAQAAADKANAAASAQQQAVSDNAAAVTTLQTTVTDLKGNQLSLATTVSDETAKIKKDIANPSALHYKGINITPGGFVAAETVDRSKATGGDIPTAFSSIPYEHADAYKLSEFYGSARQSRITLLAEGKVGWGTLRGYYEADFLGTGITSNNNQSNSYVLRQRILYAQAETNDHWTFAGGQLWSLATEQKKGITSAPGDVTTPLTIDPNYVPGFVWTRQYGFRVVKSFDKAAFGFSLENPQLLYTASLAGNTPYAVLGSAGANGGNYNAGISACTPSTSIVNYSNQQVSNGAGGVIDVAVPVYKTVNGCANLATLSFNQAPDVILKATFDPGFGHYEIFGIGGFAHETVYPGETTNSNLYGGLKDVAANLTVAPSLPSASAPPVANSNSIKLGGIGGSLRVPVIKDKLTVGAKGLYGPGMGRYGDSTLADVTADNNGNLAPIHNVSGLFTVEATPTPRMVIYLNYGGDYAGRTDFGAAGVTTTLGAPNPCFVASLGTPCLNTAGKLTLPSTVTAAQLTSGQWGGTWAAPSNAAVGYGSRLLSNSSCTVDANPGYNGGASTGYAPGGSCGAQSRDVQEITGGYWYDIYKGDRGRLRQGIQYGYAVREGWSGASGIGAKGIDNMVWTTFRYYLP
jgi:Skp family chaperone for outer membrane proteins